MLMGNLRTFLGLLLKFREQTEILNNEPHEEAKQQMRKIKYEGYKVSAFVDSRKSTKWVVFKERNLGDTIDHIQSLLMIINFRVEPRSHGLSKKILLERPAMVQLSQKGQDWVGYTDQLEKGNYQCSLMFVLFDRELGCDQVTLDRDDRAPIYVIVN